MVGNPRATGGIGVLTRTLLPQGTVQGRRDPSHHRVTDHRRRVTLRFSGGGRSTSRHSRKFSSVPAPPHLPPWCSSHAEIHSTHGESKLPRTLRGRRQVHIEDSLTHSLEDVTDFYRHILRPRPRSRITLLDLLLNLVGPSLSLRPGLCAWARRPRVGILYSHLNTSGASGMDRRMRFPPPLRPAPVRRFLFPSSW